MARSAGPKAVGNAGGSSLPAALASLLDRQNKRLNAEKFCQVLREYPDSDGLKVYVYRRYPVIDRRLLNPKAPVHITSVTGEDARKVNAEWLLREWGSGEYRLSLVDDLRPQGKQSLCNTVLEVSDPERPPVIEDLAELVVEHPKNRSYVKGLRARGELPPENSAVVEVGGAAPVDPATHELAGVASEVIREGLRNQQAPAGAITEIGRIYREAATEAVKLAGGNQRTDPIDQARKLKELVAGDTGLVKLLVEQAARDRELVMNLLTRERTDTIDSELGKLEKLMSVISKLGASGSGGSSVWEHLPALFDSGARLLQAAASVRAAQPPAQARAPAGVSSLAVPGPAPAPASGQPGAGQVPTGQSTAGAAGNPGASPPGEAGGAVGPGDLARIAPQLAAKACEAIQRDVPGDVFAETVCLWYGDAVYDQLRALGADRVLDLVRQSVPTETLPAAEAFIKAFFDYANPPAGENEATGGAGEPAAPAPDGAGHAGNL